MEDHGEVLLVPCPFPDRSNPHGEAAAAYVREVAREAGVSGRAGAKVLHGMALGEASALTWPDATPERLNVGATWIAFLVLFDDAWGDLLSFDGDWRGSVLAQHQLVHRLLDGEPVDLTDQPLLGLLDRILRDMAAIDGDWDGSRFRAEVKRYLAGTLWELDMRSRGQVPDLATYLRMRRVFSTMTVQVELDYFVGELTLSEPLRTHPVVQLADAAVADYGCLANDLYSLAAEQEQGSISNVVTVLSNEYGWTSEQSVAHATRLCAQALATFQDVRSRLGLLGLGAEEDLRRYLDHYEAFMSAAARWPARSARYRAQAGVI